MRRLAWLAIGIVLVGITAVALYLLFARAPDASGVETDAAACESCLPFPQISGENLLGDLFQLPADFSGETVLVIVPFDEEQQVSAAAWLPLAQEIAESQPDFTYYNVPIFPGMSAPLRTIIRAGMSITITDADLRERTITVFLEDLDAFLNALEIPNTDVMQVFLLNSERAVIWRGTGSYDDVQGAALRARLNE